MFQSQNYDWKVFLVCSHLVEIHTFVGFLFYILSIFFHSLQILNKITLIVNYSQANIILIESLNKQATCAQSHAISSNLY